MKWVRNFRPSLKILNKIYCNKQEEKIIGSSPEASITIRCLCKINSISRNSIRKLFFFTPVSLAAVFICRCAKMYICIFSPISCCFFSRTRRRENDSTARKLWLRLFYNRGKFMQNEILTSLSCNVVKYCGDTK